MWRYGPWAVVVGASEGIGAAFATELAARGSHVVLVARRQDPLDELAARLRAGYGVRTLVVAVDAGTPDGVAELRRIRADVGLLVCNAALAPIAPFLDLTPTQLDAMLDLNCRATAQLAHAFGERMVARGRGGIVLLSSMAGDNGSALVAHYSATKAYLRVLAEGLWAELRPHGVDVLASCPGLVSTPTFASTGAAPAGRLLKPLAPRDVAVATLAALGRRPVVIPGWRNRFLASAARLLPRRRVVALASARTRAMYPTESHHPAPADGSGG